LLPGDIGERSEAKAIAQRAIDEFGTIDILVNNAAFQRTYDGEVYGATGGQMKQAGRQGESK
jgi:NAD(P)-dependent dehydrogenase (short-subunit alcohol dehydrogenase family)